MSEPCCVPLCVGDKKSLFSRSVRFLARRGRVAPLATPRRAPRPHPSRVDKRSQQQHLSSTTYNDNESDIDSDNDNDKNADVNDNDDHENVDN